MNKNQPPSHHHRSIRLAGYDYSEEGAYFVTIVTHQREHLFGEVVDGEMRLNEFGKIVREEWFKTQDMRLQIELSDDEFVVMPNHVHGIIQIIDSVSNKQHYSHGTGDLQVARTSASSLLTRPRGPLTRSIGAIIAGFKSAVTKRINIQRCTPCQPIWLRNYYEHIIMSDEEYANIAAYIEYNPLNWGEKDEFYR
jgi:putative transposase